MKKILLIKMILSSLFILACSQNVPTMVKQSFSKKFPLADQVRWTKEDSATFEAEFKLNGKEMSANFDEKGIWFETEAEITEEQLPDTIKAALLIHFKDYIIQETTTVEEPGKSLKYEIGINKDKEKLEVIFTVDGQLLDKKRINPH